MPHTITFTHNQVELIVHHYMPHTITFTNNPHNLTEVNNIKM